MSTQAAAVTRRLPRLAHNKCCCCVQRLFLGWQTNPYHDHLPHGSLHFPPHTATGAPWRSSFGAPAAGGPCRPPWDLDRLEVCVSVRCMQGLFRDVSSEVGAAPTHIHAHTPTDRKNAIIQGFSSFTVGRDATFDVVVVGGGAIGSSVAYHAATLLPPVSVACGNKQVNKHARDTSKNTHGPHIKTITKPGRAHRGH